MKCKLILFTFIYLISSGAQSVSVTLAETVEQEPPRWFEVEVIFFKQIADKTLLKEQFSRHIQLPKYTQSFDLLTPYLQPNISALKRQLAQCEPSKSPVNAALKASKIIPLKSFEHINTESPVMTPGLAQPVLSVERANLLKLTPQYPYFPDNQFCLVNKKLLTNQLNLPFQNIDTFPIDDVPTTIKASGLRNDNQPYLINEHSLQLTDIITRLKWSKNFKPLLHLGWRQIGITRKDAIPVKIFAGEHLEQTYQRALKSQNEELARLISSEIQTDLQADLKDDLKADLQSNTNTKLDREKLKQQSVVNMTEAPTLQPASSPSQQKIQQQQRQQLTHIFENIASINENTLSEQAYKTFISSIDGSQIKHDRVIHKDDAIRSSSDLGIPLKKPSQPWFLDGFLKVHLDHYLYITADFNIVDQTPSPLTIPVTSQVTSQVTSLAPNHVKENISDDQQSLKVINFSQDKRVISGEVHYFDHPYMGIIVQIRRFDPTKPDGEAVSQAIR